MKNCKEREFPRSRKSGLVVRQLDDELLIYDLSSDKAFCLNGTAAAVWRECNGRRDAEEIAKRLALVFETGVAADVVRLALQQLAKAGLVEPGVSGPSVSRRELLGRLGRASLVALPVITSVVAPTVAMAASCLADSSCSAATVGKCCCDARKQCTQILGIFYFCVGAVC